MQYIKGLDAFDGRNHTAVTLGKFDGLHRGHQKLLNRIIKYAQKEDCDSVVCAFDMNRDCLMTNEERRTFLEDKVDYLIEIPFTREMMEMEAEKFIDEILHKKLHAAHIVVGTDFNFGHEKRGNHQMLEKYAAKYGYTVDVVEKAYYKDREISSTYIRGLLLDGNVPLANELLGYPYEITSVVEHGQQLGRTLGFPTMNLAPQEKKILPKYGVYACRVLVDGVWYGGVGNAGVKPTVAEEKRRLFEVYVYGYEGDAYGKTATVQILEFERPETRFHSVDELKDRVMKDMKYGEEYLKKHPLDERLIEKRRTCLMREVKAVKINASDFAPYGTFCSMTEPKGYPLEGEIHKFYPDCITGTCVGTMAFSPIEVRKDERIVRMAEYHTTTWEGIVALDDDMLIHVAPASGGTPVPELAKAFLVPKGCMVKINAAIWHLCPLPANNDVLHAMIVLPECTYANDCTVVEFEEKDWFKIIV